MNSRSILLFVFTLAFAPGLTSQEEEPALRKRNCRVSLKSISEGIRGIAISTQKSEKRQDRRYKELVMGRTGDKKEKMLDRRLQISQMGTFRKMF